MKIYCEDSLLYADEFFSDWGEVFRFSGRTVQAEQLQDADILLVRSTTQVNRELIEVCPRLQYVGTATAGTNHMDTDYLSDKGIAWGSAAGCNAIAVAEYVISCLFALAGRQGWSVTDKRMGIVGAGHVGTALARKLSALNIDYLLCDPPLADAGDPRNFVGMDAIMDCDIISLHVPLIRSGPYPTHHLFDAVRLANLSDDQILINACRGEVIDNRALLEAFKAGRPLQVVLDVWEKEPEILFELIPHLALASAHIAGHTLEGKARGTEMLYLQLAPILARPAKISLPTLLPRPTVPRLHCQQPDQAGLASLVFAVYDVRNDDAAFRQGAGTAARFEYIRKHYAIRREFASVQVSCGNCAMTEAIYGLGFSPAHI